MRESPVTTVEFLLDDPCDQRRLDGIRSGLCQIRGISLIDINLVTGRIRVESNDAGPSRDALDSAVHRLRAVPRSHQ